MSDLGNFQTSSEASCRGHRSTACSQDARGSRTAPAWDQTKEDGLTTGWGCTESSWLECQLDDQGERNTTRMALAQLRMHQGESWGHPDRQVSLMAQPAQPGRRPQPLRQRGWGRSHTHSMHTPGHTCSHSIPDTHLLSYQTCSHSHLLTPTHSLTYTLHTLLLNWPFRPRSR